MERKAWAGFLSSVHSPRAGLPSSQHSLPFLSHHGSVLEHPTLCRRGLSTPGPGTVWAEVWDFG